MMIPSGLLVCVRAFLEEGCMMMSMSVHWLSPTASLSASIFFARKIASSVEGACHVSLLTELRLLSPDEHDSESC